ncbi:MAG: hypothetical protein K2R98_15130 [Gemmataceae bacterium]|nr:hypothetical protein [Gemmataceae bacterium]
MGSDLSKQSVWDLPGLHEVLKDKDAEVRRLAAEAFKKIDPKEAAKRGIK